VVSALTRKVDFFLVSEHNYFYKIYTSVKSLIPTRKGSFLLAPILRHQSCKVHEIIGQVLTIFGNRIGSCADKITLLFGDMLTSSSTLIVSMNIVLTMGAVII
jgi:hypothetical protein